MKYLKITFWLLAVSLVISNCRHEEKDFIKPVPVINTPVQVGSASFVASWQPLLGAIDYTLEVATDEMFEGNMVSGFPKVLTDTAMLVANLEANKTYYYRIKASKYNGPTEYSQAVEVRTGELSVPVPLDAAKVTPISFVAQWQSAPEAEAYLLYIATDVNFSNILEGYNGKEVNDTTLIINNLVINHKYFYRVKAKRGKSISEYSPIIFAPTSELATPAVIEASEVSHTSFTINWEAVSGATSYLVYVSADPLVTVSLPEYAPKEVKASPLIITGLNAQTKYYYRVQAKNNISFSGKSEIKYAETLPLDLPEAMTATNIQINSFVANWKAVDNAGSYFVDVARDAEFTSYLSGYKAKEVADTFLVVNNLLKNTSYYYRVQAKGLGAISGNSNTVNVTTNSFASPVALNAVDVQTTSFKAVWQPVLDAEGYLLEVATDVNFNNILTDYQNLEVQDTIASITGLTLNKYYYYRVRAIKRGVNSGYSNIISQSTTDLVKPVILSPTGISLTSFTANWQIVSGASHYLFDLSTDPLFTEVFPDFNARTVSQNYIEVTGLDADKNYYYRVRATNGKVVSENSDTGNAKTSAIDPPGAIAASSIQYNSFQANWNGVQDAESYLLDVAVDPNFKSLVPGYNAKEVSTNADVVLNLEPSTLYYYRVKAKGLNSTSSYSATITVTTAPLSAPVAMGAANRKAFGFTATWQSAAGAESYLLYVATDDKFLQPVPGYSGKEVVGTSWEVTNLSPYETYYYRLVSKRLTKTSSASNVTTVSPCINNSCRLAKREYTGLYRETYTYGAGNQVTNIDLVNPNTLEYIQETTITYSGSYIDSVFIRKNNAGVMELAEKWAYVFSGGLLTHLTKFDASNNVLVHFKYLYSNGRITELQMYSDKTELLLLNKEVPVYNANGQITTIRDNAGADIKKFVYNTEYNAEYLMSAVLQMLLFQPEGSTNLPVSFWKDLSYYQYYDTGSSTWKSYSYVYEYNARGIPLKLLGSGEHPDMVYEFENCTF